MTPVGHRLNAPRILCEEIDAEVVLIDLGTGTYFSIRGAGVAAWRLLSAGAGIDAAAAALGAAWGLDPANVRTELERFAKELERDELVVDDATTGPPALPDISGIAAGPLEIERFTDMQHLIGLDPVHDVDDASGWPHTGAGGG